jgi:hypothetical protein
MNWGSEARKKSGAKGRWMKERTNKKIPEG